MTNRIENNTLFSSILTGGTNVSGSTLFTTSTGSLHIGQITGGTLRLNTNHTSFFNSVSTATIYTPDLEYLNTLISSSNVISQGFGGSITRVETAFVQDDVYVNRSNVTFSNIYNDNAVIDQPQFALVSVGNFSIINGQFDYTNVTTGRLQVGTNVSTSPSFSKMSIWGTRNSISSGSHIWSCAQTTTPELQMLNLDNNNISLSFDAYRDTIWNWKVSATTNSSGYVLYKRNNTLQWNTLIPYSDAGSKYYNGNLALTTTEGTTFGQRIAMSKDGQLLLINELVTPSVLIYNWTGFAWNTLQRVSLTNASTGMGLAMSGLGDHFFIGNQSTNTIRGYRRTGAGLSWSQAASTFGGTDISGTDTFGKVVKCSSDAVYVFVSDPTHTHSAVTASGAVYAYTAAAGVSSWSFTQEIRENPGTTNAEFGYSMCCSANGGYLFVASLAVGTGQVNIFTLNGGTWSLTQTVVGTDSATNDLFGSGLACSADGVYLFCGAPSHNTDSGAIYIFELSSGTWTQIQKVSSPQSGIRFGTSICCSDDGVYLYSGAPRRDESQVDVGAVYLYKKTGTWVGLERKYEETSGQSANDRFGMDLATNNTGLLSITSSGNDTKGNVLLFVNTDVNTVERSLRNIMTFASDGNIGIGTTVPSGIMSISKDTALPGEDQALDLGNDGSRKTYLHLGHFRTIGIDSGGSLLLMHCAAQQVGSGIIATHPTVRPTVTKFKDDIGFGYGSATGLTGFTPDYFQYASYLRVYDTDNAYSDTTMTLGSFNIRGDLLLTNTHSNMIIFNKFGFGIPSTSNRTLGAKVVLWPGINHEANDTRTDYAIGMENANTLWFGSNLHGTLSFYGGHRWYRGTENIMNLSNRTRAIDHTYLWLSRSSPSHGSIILGSDWHVSRAFTGSLLNFYTGPWGSGTLKQFIDVTTSGSAYSRICISAQAADTSFSVLSINTNGDTSTAFGSLPFETLVRNDTGPIRIASASNGSMITFQQGRVSFIDSTNTTSGPMIDLGFNISGRNADAGKFGYNILTPTPHTFDIIGAGTNSTDRLVRMYNNVSIGAGSITTVPLYVGNGSGSVTTGSYLYKDYDTGVLSFEGPDSANIPNVSIYSSGAIVSGIGTSPTASVIVVSSDKRIKKDITPLGTEVTDIVSAVRVTKYKLKERDSDWHIGVIAQEVEKVINKGVISETVHYIPNILKRMKVSELIEFMRVNKNVCYYIRTKSGSRYINTPEDVNDLNPNDLVVLIGKQVTDYKNVNYKEFIPILVKCFQMIYEAKRSKGKSETE